MPDPTLKTTDRLTPDQAASLRDAVERRWEGMGEGATDEQARNFAIDSWRYAEGFENGRYPTREACEAALESAAD